MHNTLTPRAINALSTVSEYEHVTDKAPFPLTLSSLHFDILTFNIITLIHKELRIILMDLLVPMPLSVSLRMTRATTYLNHFQSSYAIAVAGDPGGAGVDSLGRKEGCVLCFSMYLEMAGIG